MKVSFFKTYTISKTISRKSVAPPNLPTEALSHHTETAETVQIAIPRELQDRIIRNRDSLRKDKWSGNSSSERLSELLLKKNRRYNNNDHLVATQNMLSCHDTLSLSSIEMNVMRYMANNNDPYRQIRDYRNISLTK